MRPGSAALTFRITSNDVTLIRDIVARMQSQPSITERGMTVGLRALNRLASSELIDRLRLRESTERLLHGASKTTVQTAARAGRTFASAQKLTRPSRQPQAPRSDLFDLQPTDEQQMLRDAVRDFSMQRLRPWAAMAITEPEAGSDSAAIRTTAKLDGDEYVLNGEKIFVTSGDRADLVVVWATLDRDQGRAAIKSFVVERDNPGLKLDRLEHKLGIRASDTANFVLEDCRVPRENLLGSAEIELGRGFSGVMRTFDNTRPLVAGMAIGVARACLERTRELLEQAGVEIDYDAPSHSQSAAAAEFIAMEADWEAARLLTLQAAWMADNRKPNSLQASMAKAKAGRTGTDIALRCVALAGAIGYGEGELLEKWARDVKILDIFEGTQQIQLLVVARLLLGKTSAELK
jgi:acyl-CoA dehydrogenase